MATNMLYTCDACGATTRDGLDPERRTLPDWSRWTKSLGDTHTPISYELCHKCTSRMWLLFCSIQNKAEKAGKKLPL